MLSRSELSKCKPALNKIEQSVLQLLDELGAVQNDHIFDLSELKAPGFLSIMWNKDWAIKKWEENRELSFQRRLNSEPKPPLPLNELWVKAKRFWRPKPLEIDEHTIRFDDFTIFAHMPLSMEMQLIGIPTGNTSFRCIARSSLAANFCTLEARSNLKEPTKEDFDYIYFQLEGFLKPENSEGSSEKQAGPIFPIELPGNLGPWELIEIPGRPERGVIVKNAGDAQEPAT